MSSVAEHSDYSDEDEDFSSLYSGACKRFKKEKQAVCSTGKPHLANKKETKIFTSAGNVSPTPVQQIDESSDEEVLRVPNREIQEVDLDETEVHEETDRQVETLEDIEDCINVSPEVSFSEDLTASRKLSEIPAAMQDEIDCEEDPLYCASLNDSQLNQTLDGDEIVVVKVRFIAQKVWRIEIKRADYFKTICQKLSEITDVDAGQIILYFNDQLLNDYDSLKTVPLGISDIIDASVCKEGVVVSSNETLLELKVQSQNRNAQVVISIRPEDPMAVLMQKYAEATGIDLSKLKFKFDGEMLEEDDTPSSLEFEGGECIDVFIRE